MAKRIIQALRNLSAGLGVHILTPEYEVLLSLLSEGPLSAEDLFERNSRSRAGFFHVLARLKRAKLIASEPGASDRRSRVYSLSPAAVETLVSAIKIMRSVHGNRVSANVAESGAETARRNEMSAFLARLPQLSCEYQILVRLFLHPGATTKEIANEVSASETKFYASLGELVEREVVRREVCSTDRRSRRFFLDPAAIVAIARAYRRVMSWLEELEGKDDPTRG